MKAAVEITELVEVIQREWNGRQETEEFWCHGLEFAFPGSILPPVGNTTLLSLGSTSLTPLHSTCLCRDGLVMATFWTQGGQPRKAL